MFWKIFQNNALIFPTVTLYYIVGAFMLNFVLCDDYSPIRDILKKYVESIFIKYNIVANIGLCSGDPLQVLTYINSQHTDVLIIDVELNSNITGIDIAKALRRINTSAYIIFLSGHMDYVFQSLKTKIFDYLLKPLAYEKLENCIVNLLNDMKLLKNNYISFGRNKIINKDSISYIEKDGMQSIVYMQTSNFVTYSSLNNLEACLPDNFIRCHKSYIINASHIETIDTTNRTVSLNNYIKCPLGPKYTKNLLEVIKNVSA